MTQETGSYQVSVQTSRLVIKHGNPGHAGLAGACPSLDGQTMRTGILHNYVPGFRVVVAGSQIDSRTRLPLLTGSLILAVMTSASSEVSRLQSTLQPGARIVAYTMVTP